MSAVPAQAKRWVLAAYAEGPIQADKNFRLETVDLPKESELKDGQVIVKVEVVAFEPAMRPSYSTDKSYRDPQPLNQTLWALGIGEVVASKSSKYPVGALVTGPVGQTDYSVISDAELHPYSKAVGPQHLSIFGPPGLAAWVGLYDVAKMKAGQTVLVSGAAGATGSLVIQMAKNSGAKKIIGICSAGKMQGVKDLGADEVLDYNSSSFEEDLKKATGEAVDVYFENVGGHVFDAALGCMAPYGVVSVCGMISSYEQRGSKERTGVTLKNLSHVLTSKLRIEGFICSQRVPDVMPKAIEELTKLATTGKIRSKLHWHDQRGIEHAPEAFAGLFTGKNDGKLLLKVQDGAATQDAKI